MIERLHVHNFRCLENFSLDLTGRPSALMIGRNGSGKSTVLECFGCSSVSAVDPAGFKISFRQAISRSIAWTGRCGSRWK